MLVSYNMQGSFDEQLLTSDTSGPSSHDRKPISCSSVAQNREFSEAEPVPCQFRKVRANEHESTTSSPSRELLDGENSAGTGRKKETRVERVQFRTKTPRHARLISIPKLPSKQVNHSCRQDPFYIAVLLPDCSERHIPSK